MFSIGPAEAQAAGFLRRQLQAELAEAGSQRRVDALGVLLVLEGGHAVVGVAAERGRPPTVAFHRVFEPAIQRRMPIPIGENRGDDASLGTPRFRLDHPAIRFQDAGFQPSSDQAEKGTVVDPFRQHRQEQVMVDVIEKALDIRFHLHGVVPVLQGAA